MILVALSTFQSRTQDAAFDEVTRHAVDGIQLTPGNLPCDGFRERVAGYVGTVRLHHGFAWDRYRRDVYDDEFRPIAIERDRSVHAPAAEWPRRRPRPTTTLGRWLPIALEHDLLVETMYPGWVLGIGAELETAMDAGLRICVDISHLWIQHCNGALEERTRKRVFDYPNVEEIHVSHNDGRRDGHQALRADTPWLDWAKERARELPVVLESYWHKATFDDRERQLDLLR